MQELVLVGDAVAAAHDGDLHPLEVGDRDEVRAARDLERLGPVVRALTVPAEAAEASSALTSALQLAGTAAAYRERAISNNDMRAAWDASAAAAGALLFFERADGLLTSLLTSPAAAARAAVAPPRPPATTTPASVR